MKKILLALLFLPSIALGQGNEPGNAHIWETAAYGAKPGIVQLFLNGNNGGITTTFEPVWPESAAYTIPSAALTTPYCASTDNTNDKAGGTGCLTMNVSGVDSSYAAFSETVTLNGQASVNLATTNVLFINSLTCLTTGSTFANTGTIRCGTGANTTGVPAVAHAHMAIGFGKSQSALYAVAAGKTLLCRNFTLSSYGVTAANTIQVVLDRFVDPVTSKVLQREYLPLALNQAGSSTATYPGVIKFAAKTIFMPQVLSAASTGPVYFSAECLLLTNSWVTSAQEIF